MARRLVHVYIFERVARRDSRGLALLCVRQYAAEHGLQPPQELSERCGKPVAVTSELGFSVSHSGALWACAVHDAEVGLDIQLAGNHSAEAIARRYFQNAEVEYLKRQPQDFYAVWCAKEAVVKYLGLGIARGFSRVCVADGHRLLDEQNGLALQYFSPATGYNGCLCTRERAEFRLIFG